MTKRTITSVGCGVALAALAALGITSLHAADDISSGTPAELVSTYNTLADVILSAKASEANVVRSILAATYRHAEVGVAAAKAKLSAGQDARVIVEKLATLVSQLGNEGDASVAAIRKRLLEGGHHHNAAGEQQGIFDEGFVIVTRAAKAKLLESSRAIGQMARAPRADALEAEWKKVQAIVPALLKAGK